MFVGAAEQDIGAGRTDQPPVALDLVFKLAWPPPRIAQRKHRRLWTAALCYLFQDVQRCSHRGPGIDLQRRLAGYVVSRMQDKAAATLDRTSEMNPDIAHLGPATVDLKLFQQIGEPHLWGGLVHDQTHCPFFRVRTHEHNAVGKARIAHARHGDKELAAQVGLKLLHPTDDVMPAGNAQAASVTAIAQT